MIELIEASDLLPSQGHLGAIAPEAYAGFAGDLLLGTLAWCLGMGVWDGRILWAYVPVRTLGLRHRARRFENRGNAWACVCDGIVVCTVQYTARMEGGIGTKRCKSLSGAVRGHKAALRSL